jgi:hypothetical protein
MVCWMLELTIIIDRFGDSRLCRVNAVLWNEKERRCLDLVTRCELDHMLIADCNTVIIYSIQPTVISMDQAIDLRGYGLVV